MTTSLTQRYIAATIEGLPENLRSEVRPELEASIADAVDARGGGRRRLRHRGT